MLVKTFFLALLSIGSTFGWLWTNKWVKHCRAGHTRAIRQADCDELGHRGMLKCLVAAPHDRTVAAVIRRCSHKLPTGHRFDQYAHKLYRQDMPRSFRAFLSHRRCAQLSQGALKRLLTSFVDNNSVPFVRAIVQHCLIGQGAWQTFLRQAQVQGRSELMVVVQSNQPGRDAAVPRGWNFKHSSSSSIPPPLNHGSHQFIIPPGPAMGGAAFEQERHIKTMPNGEQVIIGRNTIYQGDGTNPMMAGAFRGNPMSVSPERVQSNVNILAQLSPMQANTFGLLSNGCAAITEAHLRQPGVSSEVIGALPLRCFQKIQPAAFAGLTPAMVSRIKWWPFVTRDQIRYVPAGDAIRTVPFDQLGQGKQRDKEDREHPCWTITKDQLRAIRRSSAAYHEYKRRCVRSAAPSTFNVMSIFKIFTISTLIGGIIFVF